MKEDDSKGEGLIGNISDVRINPASNRPTNLGGSNDLNNINNNDIKLSPYRFVIVFVYFLLNFINGVHWVTFASCAAKFGKFYHLNNYLVDLFSLLFMILYPIACIPEAYIIDHISMYIGLSVSALLLIIGSFLKIFVNTSIAFAYIGQFLTALFQPAILNSPGKIAARWFDDKSRTLVTSICCVSNTIGVMFGYLIHDFVIEENTVNPKMWRDSFEKYIIVEFIITLFCGFLFIFFMKNKPQNPPSRSQDNYQPTPFKEGIQKLKSNDNFIKLLISLTCIVGFINTFGTIFNSYMALYKIKDSTATYTAAVANLFGIITALITGTIIDKYKKYKLVMIICNVLSIVVYIITIILMETVNKKYLPIISFICYTLIIGSAVPIYTSGMDFVCEITYPVGESFSEGVIMSFNQIMGIIGIIITDSFRIYLKEYKFLTNLFCLLLFVISCISLLLVNQKLVRNQQDNENNENNEYNENNNIKDNKKQLDDDDDEEKEGLVDE